MKSLFKLPYFIFLIILELLISCGIQKKIVYFNNENATNLTTDSIPDYFYSPIFQSNDRISVVISSSDLKTVIPFNNENKNNDENSSNVNNNTGYLIDKDGYIDYPILGKLKIAGLNRTQTCELFKDKLKEYVTDPSVNIQLLNFKITVLGDVLNPGTFEIQGERISLLEALGLAKDLNVSAVRTNVLLIREFSGIKKEIRIDLTSKSFLKSQYYYLKQNDIIYVQPNKFKTRSQQFGGYINTSLTVLSLLITSIIFITN